MKAFFRQLIRMNLEIHNLNKQMERVFGVSLIQWQILELLKDLPAISASALAEVAQVHPSTLTQSLRRLSKKGMLFVGTDPKDSRKKIVSITHSGVKVLHAVNLTLTHLLNPSSSNGAFPSPSFVLPVDQKKNDLKILIQEIQDLLGSIRNFQPSLEFNVQSSISSFPRI